MLITDKIICRIKTQTKRD